VIPFPPNLIRSASRGSPSRRRLGRVVAMAMAIAVALTCGACETHVQESLAGLAVVSFGPMTVTNDEGALEPIAGPPGDVRSVTASSGRIAAETVDHQFFVSDAPSASATRTWRRLAIEAPPNLTPSGMDLSPEGRVLAIVFGDPNTAGLQLVTIDVETGETDLRPMDLASNGPPSWLGPQLLALEVIRPDQRSGTATVNPATGETTITDAEGFAPSATADGNRIAVAGSPDGIVITDTVSWIKGNPVAAPGIAPPAESSLQDLALDADGTRLAVVYTANSGAASTVMILRLAGTVWEIVASIPMPGDAAVSVDWLN
jgi:hypothetical protein